MAQPDEAAYGHACGLLRWGFLAPDRDAWSVIRSTEWIDAVAGALKSAEVPDPQTLLIELQGAAQSFGDRDEWEAEANHAFGPAAAVSPHETEYTSQRNPFMQANELADIRGFYVAFGVEPSQSHGERADHVGLELEFMHMLACKIRDSDPNNESELQVPKDAARKFLECHLGRFAGAMAGQAENAPIHPFYAYLVALTGAVVDTAIKTLGLKPVPATGSADEPQEPDEMGCQGCPAVVPGESLGPQVER